ncbi:unnamed protein product [Phytophthora lilii]|uniref:Unnamed protein product n=1 Tax=Phytophthora lilii TaxID=2077276 RepID=A0A9W7CT81_9STRA|nr:unnamed protein product [Phytophthora lilii]
MTSSSSILLSVSNWSPPVSPPSEVSHNVTAGDLVSPPLEGGDTFGRWIWCHVVRDFRRWRDQCLHLWKVERRCERLL